MKTLLISALGIAAMVNAAMASRSPANAPTPSVSDRLNHELAKVGAERFTAPDYKPGTIRHVVLFRYAETVTAEQRLEAKRRFLTLQSECTRDGHPYIVSIETGAQSSGEGADQGLEQGFIVTFASEGDRNFYVGRPIVGDAAYFDGAHQTYKDFVGPLLAPGGVVVFDFVVEDAGQGSKASGYFQR